MVATAASTGKAAAPVDGTEADKAFAAADFDRARALYVAAKSSAPASAHLWSRLGELDLFDNRLPLAESEFAAALKLDPGSREAERGLADAKARARLSAPLASTVTVPLLAIDPLPVVKVRLNGVRDAYFLIDTGAPGVTLDPKLASELDAKSSAVGTGVFAGGKSGEIRRTVLDSLALGAAQLKRVDADIMPMEGAPSPKGVRIEGVIGTGVFYRYLTTLDYRRGRLVLAPKSQSRRFERQAKAHGAAISRLWFAPTHFLFARARANDRMDGLFNIDTGGEGVGVQLAERLVDTAGVRLDASRASKMMGGGGEVTVIPFTASVDLGGRRRADVPGMVTKGGDQYGIFPFEVAGTLSHEYFKGHAVTFDFSAMRLVVD